MSVRIEVPIGLTELLQRFTITVLREFPSFNDDLVQFAADYFNKLNEDRLKELSLTNNSNKKSGGVRFGKEESIEYSHQHQQHQSDRHDQNDDDDDEDDDDNGSWEGPPKEQLYRRPSVAAESFDPGKDDSEDEAVLEDNKSDEQKERLQRATENILIFRCLDNRQRDHVIRAMKEVQVEAGQTIITQGEEGDNFYVIEKGRFEAFAKSPHSGEERLIHTYQDEGSFGELALMYNTPRAATIISTTPGILWSMDRRTFRSIVLKSAFRKRQLYEALLKKVVMLAELSDYERATLADALQSKEFADGEVIITQGNAGKQMFFIEEGQVRFMRRSNSLAVEQKEVNLYHVGDYFGELSLITHNPIAATAIAVGHTKLAALDIKAFERLMGPCIPIMQRNFELYRERLKEIFGDEEDIPELRGEKEAKVTHEEI